MEVKGVSLKPVLGKPVVIVERLPEYVIRSKRVRCRLCDKRAKYRVRYQYPKDHYIGDPVIFMVCGRHLRAVGVSYIRIS